ncbi:MAG: LamG-like jellyroll fold domain-containing protein [archaeon]
MQKIVKRALHPVLGIFLFLVVVFAAPQFEIGNQSPVNGSFSRFNYTAINETITEQNMDSFILNWDGANYSFYEDSLVLMMSFEDSAGLGESYSASDSFVRDTSKSGNNGTTCGGLGATWTSAGKYGGMTVYNGSTQYVDILNSPTLNFGQSDDSTVMGWVKTNMVGYQTWFDKSANNSAEGANKYHMWYLLTPNQKFDCRTGKEAVAWDSFESLSTYTVGEWAHIACVKSGNTIYLYINGEYDSQSPLDLFSGATPSIDHANIGRFRRDNIYYFNGSIDEVRVYRRALTGAEIWQQYSSNLREYDSNKWEFYSNQTNLTDRAYSFYTYANDTVGGSATTETRTVTVDTGFPSTNFSAPTLENATHIRVLSTIVNLTSSDSNYHYVIADWNRSLVGWFGFDSYNSTHVTDSSTWGNDAWFGGNFNERNFTGGKYGLALAFDGTNDYIEVNQTQSINNINSGFTFTGWVNFHQVDRATDTYDWQTFFAKSNYGSWYSLMLCTEAADCGGNKVLRFYTPGLTPTSVDYNWNSVQANVWYHVGVTYNTTHIAYYIDGNQVSAPTVSGAVTTNSNPLLIGYAKNGPYPFDGQMDELTFWNRALSPLEINATMNASLPRYEYNFTNLPDGPYTLQAYSKDAAGNVNQTEQLAIAVDTRVPGAYFDSPTPANNSLSGQNSVYVNITASDANQRHVVLDWNNSLKGWWRLEDNFVDESGNNNLGECTNCPSYTLSGKSGGAYQFNSDTSSYILINDSSSLDVTKQITLETWIKPATYRPMAIVGKWNTVGGGHSYVLYSNGIASAGFRLNNGATNFIQLTGWSTDPPLNQWSHLVATYNGTTAKVYVNGDEVASQTAVSTILSSASWVSIGREGYGNYYNGSIDEVKIYSRALHPDEINASMNANLWKYGHNFTNLADGAYNFTAYVVDAAGNKNQTEARTLTIDSTIPQIQFETPTYPNNTILTLENAPINISLTEANLNEFILNWNNTNISLYDDSLLAMFNFDNVASIGDSASAAADLSKSENNASINSATYSTDSKYGSSIYFDGSSSYVQLSNPGNFNFSGGSFTASAWIKAEGLGSNSMGAIVARDVGTNFKSWWIRVESDYRVRFLLSEDGGPEPNVYSTSTVQNQWTHVTAVKDNDNERIYMYINGVMEGNVSDTSGSNDPTNPIPVRIGDFYSAVGREFNGKIDEVRIWNRSLAPYEVKQVYSANLRKYDLSRWALFSNQTNLTDGIYTYYGYAKDVALNANQTEIRTLVIDVTPPNVSQNTPLANYLNDTSYPANILFNCSAADWYGLSNISLYITNSQNSSFALSNSSDTGGSQNSSIWALALSYGNYTWGCLAHDLTNHSTWTANRTITVNFTDMDGDGIADPVDNLEWSASDVDVTGATNFDITISGNSTTGTYDDVHDVAFYDASSRIMNFTHNFTAAKFNLARVSVKLSPTYIIANLSGQLQGRKTMYIADNNFIALCVKDAEISDISSMTADCSGVNETDFTTCLGNSTGVTNNSLTCYDEGSMIRITNLTYSALRGTPAPATGGGGGGTLKAPVGYNITSEISLFGISSIKLSLAETQDFDYILYDFDETTFELKISKRYTFLKNAVFELLPTQKEISLNTGEYKPLDLNGDGKKDITLTLDEVKHGYVSVTVARFPEPAHATPISDNEESLQIPTPKKESVAEQPETKEPILAAEMETKKHFPWWLLLVILLLAAYLRYNSKNRT